MERLTAKNKHGKPIIKDWPNYMEFDIVNRLSSIEDILGDEYDLDRLRELAQADKLIGKTVWLTKWFTKKRANCKSPITKDNNLYFCL